MGGDGAESLREDGEGGGSGGLPAAKLQSPSCHLVFFDLSPPTNPIIILSSNMFRTGHVSPPTKKRKLEDRTRTDYGI